MNRDLSKYSYRHYEDAYNIGWNRNGSGVQETTYDTVFLDKLKRHCEVPLNVDYNGKYREKFLNGQKVVSGFGGLLYTTGSFCRGGEESSLTYRR